MPSGPLRRTRGWLPFGERWGMQEGCCGPLCSWGVRAGVQRGVLAVGASRGIRMGRVGGKRAAQTASLGWPRWGWLMCPGMCVGAVPGRSRVRRSAGARGLRLRPGRRGRRWGRSALARCSHSTLLQCFCTLMQMHWPEWFISSMWNGIMHPHPISLMKKREPAPGTKLPTLG